MADPIKGAQSNEDIVKSLVRVGEDGKEFISDSALTAAGLSPAHGEQLGYDVKNLDFDNYWKHYNQTFKSADEARSAFAMANMTNAKRLEEAYNATKTIDKDITMLGGVRYKTDTQTGETIALDAVNPTPVLASMWGGVNDPGDTLPHNIATSRAAKWNEDYKRMGVRSNFGNLSDEEIAQARGVYIKRGAKLKKKLVPSYDENGNFVQKEEIDQDAIYGNLGDFATGAQQYDENGRPITLVKTYDPINGQPTWAAVDADVAINSDILRSTWGAQKKRSNTSHVFDSFANAIIGTASAVTGTLPQTVGTFGEWAFGGGGGFENLKKWGYKNINYYDAQKFKIGEEESKQGIFDSWGGFLRTGGDVVGQLVGTMGAGYLAKAGLAGLSAANAARGAAYLSRSVGATQAAHFMNEESIKMGIPEKDRAVMSVAAGLACLAAEGLIGKLMPGSGLLDDLTAKGASDIYKKAFQEEAKKMVAEVGAKIMSATSLEAKQKIAEVAAKGFAAKALEKGRQALNLLKAPGAWQQSAKRPVRMTGTAFEDGGEELVENVITQGQKAVYDTWYSASDSEKGDGKYGVGFEDAFDDFWETFVGGMLGGAVGGITTQAPFQDQKKYRAAAQVVAGAQSWDEVEKWANDTWSDGEFDNPFLTKEGDIISTYQAADGTNKTLTKQVSRNDIARDAFLEQLKAMYAVKERSGFTTPEVLDKLFLGDTELLVQTMSAIRTNDVLVSQAKDARVKAEEAKSNNPNTYAALDEAAKTIENKVAENQKLIDKITSGQFAAEYMAEKMLVSTDMQLAVQKDRKARVEALVAKGDTRKDAEFKAAIDTKALNEIVQKYDLPSNEDTQARTQRVVAMAKRVQEARAGNETANKAQENIDRLNQLISAKAVFADDAEKKTGIAKKYKVGDKEELSASARAVEIRQLVGTLDGSFKSKDGILIGNRMNADKTMSSESLHQNFLDAKAKVANEVEGRLQMRVSNRNDAITKANAEVRKNNEAKKKENVQTQIDNKAALTADPNAVTKDMQTLEDEAPLVKGRQYNTEKQEFEDTPIGLVGMRGSLFEEFEEQSETFGAEVLLAEKLGITEDELLKDEWLGSKISELYEFDEQLKDQDRAKLTVYKRADSGQILSIATTPEIAGAKKGSDDKLYIARKNDKGDEIQVEVTATAIGSEFYELSTIATDLIEKAEALEAALLAQGVTVGNQAAYKTQDGKGGLIVDYNRAVQTMSDFVALAGFQRLGLTESQKAHLGVNALATLNPDNTEALEAYFMQAGNILAKCKAHIDSNRDMRKENLNTYARESGRITAHLLVALKEDAFKGGDYAEAVDAKGEKVEAPNDVALLAIVGKANGDLTEDEQVTILKAQSYWYNYSKHSQAAYLPNLDFVAKNIRSRVGTSNSVGNNVITDEYSTTNLFRDPSALLSSEGIQAITFENFKDSVGLPDSATAPITSDKGQWNLAFGHNFLRSTFLVDSKEAMATINTVVGVTGDNKFVAAHTQEQVASVVDMFAHYQAVMDDTSRAKDFLTSIFATTGTVQKGSTTLPHLINSMTVLGPAGAGKTSFLFDALLSILKNKGIKGKIYISAPEASQVVSLQESVTRLGIDKSKVVIGTYAEIKAALPKTGLTKDDVFVMDESSLVDSDELMQLAETHRSAPFFFFNDPYQCPPEIAPETKKDIHRRTAARTVNLTQIMRADVGQVGAVQTALRKAIFENQTVLPTIANGKYEDKVNATDPTDTTAQRGVRGYNGYAGVMQAFKDRLTKLGNPTQKDIMFIVWDQAMYDKAVADLDPKYKHLVFVISKAKGGAPTAQGLTTQEAYIHIDQDYFNGLLPETSKETKHRIHRAKTYARFLLTAASRPKLFLAHSGGDSTSVYEKNSAPLEQGAKPEVLAADKLAFQQRIASINEKLGGVAAPAQQGNTSKQQKTPPPPPPPADNTNEPEAPIVPPADNQKQSAPQAQSDVAKTAAEEKIALTAEEIATQKENEKQAQIEEEQIKADALNAKLEVLPSAENPPLEGDISALEIKIELDQAAGAFDPEKALLEGIGMPMYQIVATQQPDGTYNFDADANAQIAAQTIAFKPNKVVTVKTVETDTIRFYGIDDKTQTYTGRALVYYNEKGEVIGAYPLEKNDNTSKASKIYDYVAAKQKSGVVTQMTLLYDNTKPLVQHIYIAKAGKEEDVFSTIAETTAMFPQSSKLQFDLSNTGNYMVIFYDGSNAKQLEEWGFKNPVKGTTYIIGWRKVNNKTVRHAIPIKPNNITLNELQLLKEAIEAIPANVLNEDYVKAIVATYRQFFAANQEALEKNAATQVLDINIKEVVGDIKFDELGKFKDTALAFLEMAIEHVSEPKNGISYNKVLGREATENEFMVRGVVRQGMAKFKMVKPAESEPTNERDEYFNRAAMQPNDVAVSEQEARAVLSDVLGETSAAALKITGERIIDGVTVLGSVNRIGEMSLSKVDADGNLSLRTVWHEAMHVVTEFMLTNEARKRLYDEVYNRTKKRGTDAVEYVAQQAELYNLERRNLKGWSKFAKKFMDFMGYYVGNIFPRFKSELSSLLYETYNQKRYRNANFQRIEMGRGELYNAIPNEMLEQLGGFKPAARVVLGEVAQEISALYLQANLDKQRVHNAVNGINFIDMMNRVESGMRRRLQGLLLQEGGIGLEFGNVGKVVQDSGNTYIETPSGLRQLVAEGIGSKAIPVYNDTSNNLVKKALREAFGNVEITLTYKGENYTGLISQLKDSKGGFGGEAFPVAERIKIMQPNSQKVAIGNNQVGVFQLYKTYMMLDKTNVEQAMRYYFPNIDFSTIKQKQNVDLLSQMVKASDSINTMENNEVSAMERQSDLIRLMLATIPVEEQDIEGVKHVKFLANPMDIDRQLQAVAARALDRTDDNYDDTYEGTDIDKMRIAFEAFIAEEEAMTKLAIEELKTEAQYLASPTEVQEAKMAEASEPSVTKKVLEGFYKKLFSLSNKDFSHAKIMELGHNYQKAVATKDATEIATAKAQAKAFYDLHKGATSSPATFESFLAELPQLAQFSNTLLNAVLVYYKSVSRESYLSLTKEGIVGELQAANADSLRLKLTDSMAATFIQNGTVGKGYMSFLGIETKGGGVSKKPGHFNIDARVNYTFRFGANSLMYSEGKDKPELPVFTLEGNAIVINKDFGRAIDRKEFINRALTSMGITVKPKTLSMLALPNKKGMGFEQFLEFYAAQMIANTVGAYQIANNVTEDDIIKGTFTIPGIINKSADETVIIDERIINYYKAAKKYQADKNAGALTDTLTTLINKTSKDGEGDDIEGKNTAKDDKGSADLNVISGLSLYKDLGKLADALLNTETDRRVAYAFTPNNKKIFIVSSKDSNMDAYRGKKSVNMALAHERRLRIVANSNSQTPLRMRYSGLNDSITTDEFNTEIYVYNPLLDAEQHSSGASIVTNVQYILGIKTGKSRGTDITEMNVADNADMQDLILKDSIESSGQEGFKVQLHNQADRGRQRLFTIKFPSLIKNGSNGVLVNVEGKNPQMDSEALFTQVANRFAMEEAAQITSLQRWVRAFDWLKAKGKTISDFDRRVQQAREYLFNPTNGLPKSLADFEKAGDFNLYRNSVDNAQRIIMSLIEENSSSLGEQFIQYSGVIATRDYMLQTIEKGTTTVVMGLESRMHDDILVGNVSEKGAYAKSPVNVFNKRNYRTTISKDGFETTVGQFAFRHRQIKRLKNATPAEATIHQSIYKNLLYKLFEENINFNESNARAFLVAGHYANDKNKEKKQRDKTLGFGGYGINQNEIYVAQEIATVLFNDFHFIANSGSICNYIPTKLEGKIDAAGNMVAGKLDFLQTANKRLNITSSPGFFNLSNSQSYLDADANAPILTMYAVMQSEAYRRKTATVDENGNVTYEVTEKVEEVNVFDGMSFANPFSNVGMLFSYGGKLGIGDKSKFVNASSDLSNGVLDAIKHASQSAGGQTLADAPQWSFMLKMMLNPKNKPVNKALTWAELDLPANKDYDSLYARFLILMEESRYDGLLKAVANMFSANTALSVVPKTREAYLNNKENLLALKALVPNIGGVVDSVIERYFANGNIDDAGRGQINSKDFLTLYEALLKAEQNPLYGDNAKIAKRHETELLNEKKAPLPNLGDVGSACVRLWMQHYVNVRYINAKNGIEHNSADYYIESIHSPDTIKGVASARKQIPLRLGGVADKRFTLKTAIGKEKNEAAGDYKQDAYIEIGEGQYDMQDAWSAGGGKMTLEPYINMIDQTTMVNQLNANRDTDDTEESPLTQIMSIILAHPNQLKNGESARIMNLLSKYIENGLVHLQEGMLKAIYNAKDSRTSDIEMAKFEQMVIAEEGSTLDAFRNAKVRIEPEYIKKGLDTYIQKFVQQKAASSSDTSVLSQLIANPKVGANFGGLQTLVYRYVSAHIKKEAIKRKMQGMRVVQAAGNLIHVFDVKIGVKPVAMTMRDMVTHYRNMGIIPEDFDYLELSELFDLWSMDKKNSPRFKELNIKYLGLMNEHNIKHTLSAPRQLKKFEVNADGKGMGKGEIVLPPAMYSKYGIPRSVGLQELFSYYTTENGETVGNSLFEDVITGSKSEREKLLAKLKSIFDTKETALIKRYTYKVNGQERIGFEIDTNVPAFKNAATKALMYEAAKVAVNTSNKALDAFYAANPNGDIEQARNAIRNIMLTYYKAFDITLNKFASALLAVKTTIQNAIPIRTPSGPGSGSLVMPIGFTDEDNSTVYINSMHTAINGSDYDIDQKTIYYKDADDKELGISDVSGDNANEVFDAIVAYYNNADNSTFSLADTTTKNISTVGKEGNDLILKGFNGVHNMFASYIMRDAAMGGAVVGPFANAQKGLSSIHTGWQINGGENSNEETINRHLYAMRLRSYELLPKDIEELVNGATDNPKLMALGAMRIAFFNANVITAMMSCANGDKTNNGASKGMDVLDHIANEEFGIYKELGYETAEKARADYQKAIFRFMMRSTAAEDLFNRLNQAKRFVNSGQNKTIYHQAYLMINETTERMATTEGPDAYRANKIKAIEDKLRAAIQSLYTAAGLAYTPEIGEQVLNMFAIKRNGVLVAGEYNSLSVRLGLTQLSKQIKQANKEYKNTAMDAIAKAIGLDAQLEVNSELSEEEAGTADGVGENGAGELAELFAQNKSTKGVIGDDDLMKALKEAFANGTSLKDLDEAQKTLTAISVQMGQIRYHLKRAVGAENDYKRKTVRNSDRYKQDLVVIAKFAMLGDWIDRYTKIVAINQGTKSESYDQYVYSQNAEFMFGVPMDKFYKIAEAYKKHIAENNRSKEEPKPTAKTPKQFIKEYAQTDADFTDENRSKYSIAKYQHRSAQGDAAWLKGTIGDAPDPTIVGGENDYLSFSDQFFKIGDALALILSQPHITTMVKSVNILDSIEEGAFPKRTLFMRGLVNEIANDIGTDRFSESQFISLEQEIDKAMISGFFDSRAIKTMTGTIVNTFYSGAPNPMDGLTKMGWSKSLQTPADRAVYVSGFASFAENHLKPAMEEAARIAIANGDTTGDINFLLEKLDTNAISGNIRYVTLNTSAEDGDIEMDRFVAAMEKLPVAIKNAFVLYQIAKDGFEYRVGNFSKVLGVKIHEQFSEYISGVYGEVSSDPNNPTMGIYSGAKEQLKLQILSQAKNAILKKSETLWAQIDGKAVRLQMPPATSYGVAKFFSETKFPRYTKRFGWSSTRFLVGAERDGLYRMGRTGKAVTNSLYEISVDSLDDTKVFIQTGDYAGLSLAAYIQITNEGRGGYSALLAEQQRKEQTIARSNKVYYDGFTGIITKPTDIASQVITSKINFAGISNSTAAALSAIETTGKSVGAIFANVMRVLEKAEVTPEAKTKYKAEAVKLLYNAVGAAVFTNGVLESDVAIAFKNAGFPEFQNLKASNAAEVRDASQVVIDARKEFLSRYDYTQLSLTGDKALSPEARKKLIDSLNSKAAYSKFYIAEIGDNYLGGNVRVFNEATKTKEATIKIGDKDLFGDEAIAAANLKIFDVYKKQYIEYLRTADDAMLSELFLNSAGKTFVSSKYSDKTRLNPAFVMETLANQFSEWSKKKPLAIATVKEFLENAVAEASAASSVKRKYRSAINKTFYVNTLTVGQYELGNGATPVKKAGLGEIEHGGDKLNMGLRGSLAEAMGDTAETPLESEKAFTDLAAILVKLGKHKHATLGEKANAALIGEYNAWLNTYPRIKESNELNEDAATALEELYYMRTMVELKIGEDLFKDLMRAYSNEAYDEVLQIERQNGMPMRVGDAIYFTNGVVGRVIDQSNYENKYNSIGVGTSTGKPKVIKYKIDRHLSTAKALPKTMGQLETKIMHSNNQTALDATVEQMKAAMPGIKVEYTTTDEIRSNPAFVEKGLVSALSFVDSGIIYLNKDKMDSGVVIHEFAHPFTFWLKEAQPELYNAVIEKLKNEPTLLSYVKAREQGADKETIENELIPYFLQLVHYQKAGMLEADETLRTLYKEMVRTFSKILPTKDTRELGAAEITTENTLGELGNALYKMLKEGAANAYTTSEFDKAATAYFKSNGYAMRANTATAASPINYGNIETLLVPNMESINIIESQIRSDISDKLRSGEKYRGISGIEYEFANKTEEAKRGLINQIVASEKPYYTKFDEKMLTFLTLLRNNGKPIPEKDYNLAAQEAGMFRAKEKYTQEAGADRTNRIKGMLSAMGFNPITDTAFSVKMYLSELGISLPTFADSDSTIIIHNKGRADERISIVNFTKQRLNFGYEKKALGSTLDPKMQSGLKETVQDVNAFKNTLLAMAIQHELSKTGKSVRVEKVATVGVYESSTKTHFKEIGDVLPAVKAIMQPVVTKSVEAGLRDVVDNEAMYDADLYDVGLMQRIALYAQTGAAQSGSPTDKATMAFNNILVAVKERESGKMTNNQHLATVIRNRIHYLRNEVFEGNKEAANQNPEYLKLLRFYLELTERKHDKKLSDRSERLDIQWLRTFDRMGGRMQNYVFELIDSAMRRIKAQLMPLVEQNKKFVKQINLVAKKLSWVTDQSAELFKPMFKTRKAKHNGQMVNVNTQEIHHDLTDPETIAALADPNSGLTKTMVEYGKFIMDNFEAELVKYLAIHNEAIYLQSAYKLDKEARTKHVLDRAREDARSKWKRGMLPAITSRYTEALSKGEFKESLNKFFQNGLFQDSPFDNYYQQKEDADGYYKLSSQFWSQFQNGEYLGGPQRLQLMGLTLNDAGELEVADMTVQQNLTMNLENAFNYTMAASMRGREMKPAIQGINVVNDYLSAIKVQRGVDTNGLQQQLDVYINRQIYGELPQTGEVAIMGAVVNIDNTLGAVGQLANLMHLSLAPMLAAKNALSASLKGTMNATINDLSEKLWGATNGFYGLANVRKAMSLMYQNPLLVNAINKRHQIVSMSERDIIGHFENVATKATLVDTDTAMLFHWWGEHYTQMIGMLAQMDKDGVLDAYSMEGEKLVYDVKKDTRFYDANGNKTEFADLLIDDIKTSQQIEGVFEVDMNGPLQSPYSQGNEARVKAIIQRFVGEVTDGQLKNQLSAYALPRAVMSMRTYLYNAVQYFWKEPSVEPMLGSRKVRLDKAGKPEVVWDSPMAEGMVNTLVYCGKMAVDYFRKTPKQQAGLSNYQKRNLVSAAMFTTVVWGLYALLSAAIDADDEEQQNTFELLTKWTVLGALQEQTGAINPIAPYKELTQKSSVYAMQISNVMDLITGTVCLPTELIGWTGEGESVKKQVADYIYTLSKNIPYATGYRNIHNLSISVWDDITGNNTEKLK